MSLGHVSPYYRFFALLELALCSVNAITCFGHNESLVNSRTTRQSTMSCHCPGFKARTLG